MISEILIVSAVILSYFGIGFVFRKNKMSPFLGLEFFLIGLLFSLLKVNKNNFIPLLPPFLSAFGLLMGMQVKFADLKALGKDFYKNVLVYSLSVFVAFFIVFSFFFPYQDASVLGAVFALVSYKVMATFIPDRKKEDREKLFFSAFVPFVCIVIYFFSAFLSFNPNIFKWFFVLFIAFSFLAKIIFSVFDDDMSLVLSVIGIVLFFSELAYIKGVSPFAVMFFVGVFLSNWCKKGDKLFEILLADEKQLYTIFLIFLGFVSGYDFNLSFLKITFVVFASVFLAKYVFFKIKKDIFFLYLSPGAFGVVLLADYWLITGHEEGSLLFSSAITVIIVLQVMSMIFLKRIYGKKD